MEKMIESFKVPADHKGHKATLEIGFYVGSGEHSINYRCDCGKKTWSLGSADPDLIDNKIWERYSVKN